MTEILRYEVGSGTVLVEAADNSFGIERPARNEQGITDAGRRLEDALSAIRPAAKAAAEVLKEVGAERLELRFGVKLAGEAGAIIAQNCSEGHFIVTLSFSHVPSVHGAHAAPEEEIIVTPEGGLENRQMPSADPAGHQREPPDQFRYPLDQLNANAVIRIQ